MSYSGVTEGSGDGEFYMPGGVAVDGSGNVYVADGGNFSIQKFSSSGRFLAKWGTYGSGDGQFIEPQGVAVDGSGNVYVSDIFKNRIQKFAATTSRRIHRIRRTPECTPAHNHS